ncbi:MAG: hypothetical protein WD960_13150 [Gemmatimonadota bacterium]
MRGLAKVPITALFMAGVLVACGGDAESAADLESERLEELLEAEEQLEELLAEEEAAPIPPRTGQDAAAAGATPPDTRLPGQDTGRDVLVDQGSAGDDLTGSDALVEEEEVPIGPLALPAGSELTALVESTISTRTHEVGDTFMVRITHEVRSADGALLVPEGARMEGRVLEATASSSADEEAVLLVAFDHLLLNGDRLPVEASLVEAELEAEAGDSGTRSVAKVATGAAAGAVIGQILGRDTRSTVTGAAAGAAAGAGVALTTRDGHAVIREGSTMVIRLESPVVIVAGG